MMLKDLSILYRRPFIGYFFLLISLYPIFTIIGQFFENIIILLLGIISIFYFINKKKLLSLKDSSFIFFFLILIISSLYTENFNNVIKSTKYIFYFFILLFCLKIKLDKEIFHLFENVFKLIIFSLLILSIDMIFQKIFGYNLLGFKSLTCDFDSTVYKNCRVSGFFGDEYVAGSFISRIIVIISIYYLLIKKKYLILFPILILSFLSIYFSGERMAFGFFIIVLLIISFYLFLTERKKLNLSKILISLLIFFLILAIALNQNTLIRFSKGLDLLYKKDHFRIDISLSETGDVDAFKFKDKYLDKEFDLIPNTVYGYYVVNGTIKELTPYYINNLNFVPSFLSKSKYKIDIDRIKNPNSKFQILSTQKVDKHFFNSTGWSAHFIAALEIFKKNIFFGSGFKSFYKECNKLDKINHIYDIHKCSIHPHNFHLEILQSTGLIGYLSFLTLIYSFFMVVIKNKNLSYVDKFFVLLMLFAIFQPITTSGSIFSSSFSNKLWIISSITIFLSRMKAYKNESNF